MKAVVVGCGLLGISTAYLLHRQGVKVTVLERAVGPARETSFANGSLLVPSMAEPWNAPGVAGHLLRSLLGMNPALVLRPAALRGLLGWGATFLRQSSEHLWRANTLKNIRLALHSDWVLSGLREELGLRAEIRQSGTLKVFRDQHSFDRAWAHARWLQSNGVPSTRLTALEAVSMEPALKSIAGRVVGGLYYPLDAVGDARAYCEALTDSLTASGGDVRFRTSVVNWKRQGNRIVAAVTNDGLVEADVFVLAAANANRRLARLLGFDVPIRPVKGYSLTLSKEALSPVPRVPVVDDATHAVVVPCGRDLRVAGVAEFAGLDLSIPPHRIQYLQGLVRGLYPCVRREALEKADTWAGLRPVSADGVAILGASPIDNLYLNTGHGHLGWTLAAGSGDAVANLITGAPAKVHLTDYGLARF